MIDFFGSLPPWIAVTFALITVFYGIYVIEFKQKPAKGIFSMAELHIEHAEEYRRKYVCQYCGSKIKVRTSFQASNDTFGWQCRRSCNEFLNICAYRAGSPNWFWGSGGLKIKEVFKRWQRIKRFIRLATATIRQKLFCSG